MGPFCQSCSRPLGKPEDFGTSSDGIRINDYCCHCFQRGAFTEPDITRQQMIDRCVAVMAERGIMPEPQARMLLTEVMPTLKRWRAREGCRCSAAGSRRGARTRSACTWPRAAGRLWVTPCT
jgi:hypothetical protein